MMNTDLNKKFEKISNLSSILAVLLLGFVAFSVISKMFEAKDGAFIIGSLVFPLIYTFIYGHAWVADFMLTQYWPNNKLDTKLIESISVHYTQTLCLVIQLLLLGMVFLYNNPLLPYWIDQFLFAGFVLMGTFIALTRISNVFIVDFESAAEFNSFLFSYLLKLFCYYVVCLSIFHNFGDALERAVKMQ